MAYLFCGYVGIYFATLVTIFTSSQYLSVESDIYNEFLYNLWKHHKSERSFYWKLLKAFPSTSLSNFLKTEKTKKKIVYILYTKQYNPEQNMGYFGNLKIISMIFCKISVIIHYFIKLSKASSTFMCQHPFTAPKELFNKIYKQPVIWMILIKRWWMHNIA